MALLTATDERRVNRLRRNRANRISLWLLIWMVGAGCVNPTGGWDVDALFEDLPALALLTDQRIGDLTPNPAWIDGRVIGVACRFDQKGTVRVHGRGAGWSPEWAAQAVGAIDRSVADVRIEVASGVEVASQIEVQSIEAPDADGPVGLGDTLALCDVSPNEVGRVRGRMIRAVIRLRRALPLPTGRVHQATEAEWIGALLHELGHALGFAGHAAVGDSLVCLEQSRLREIGRLAAAGESVPAPNLTALYQIEPGRELVQVGLTHSGEAALVAFESRLRERERRLGPALQIVSIAGDRQARLRWEWEGGLALAIDFPNWGKGLSDGAPLDAVFSQVTLRSFEREY